MKKIIFAFLFVFVCFSSIVSAHVPLKILVQIVRAEDELRYDVFLENLMKNPDAHIRERAALAAGRIGNASAIPALAGLLENDKEIDVQTIAAFSIGEIESIEGADAILNVLDDSKSNPKIRARAIEAAGKIAAANAKNEKSKKLGEAIVRNLEFEDEKRSGPFLKVIEFGLTAVLRARPENAERIVIEYTTAYTPQIRANALNTLSRLRSKNANKQARELLQKDEDAIVRANAARLLGAAEDKDSFELLLKSAIEDKDSRVRVSAIRALGNLKDAKAADKLIERGTKLFGEYLSAKTAFVNPKEKSEILEIATVLGRLSANSNDEKAVNYLQKFREADKYQSPESEISFAQIAPEKYLNEFSAKNDGLRDWRIVSSYAQGLGEIAKQTNENIKKQVNERTAAFFSEILEKTPPAYQDEMNKAAPDLLRAVAAYKSEILPALLQQIIGTRDLITRATAAELLAELPPTEENFRAVETAFTNAIVTDKQSNDAQLAMLDALYKLDAKRSEKSLLIALVAPDYLVRKKALDLIENGDAANVSPALKKAAKESDKTVEPLFAAYKTKLGQILNKEADYVRAVSRKNGSVKAIFATEKGNFTIDLTPEDAPLTVDNFVKLAKANYFNGVSVHRVVPNFVMQDGDPRGDGNGGPGWQIRCEINMSEFGRGAVGMALSGKDTGGSQWFVTHSSQPHLDGGYTVFGSVNESDMKIVDSIVRGDKILSVKIVEEKSIVKK